ncbi:MAG: hypothetical protein J6T70_17740, partial [Bacteroidales bacterium]|nr:hypothetical protein [Bacteroidales bacterium]
MLSTAAHINYGAKSQIPKVIVENPFRMLGVFANSSQKDIVANQGKANAFLKVGRAVEYPLDLKTLMPQVNRTVGAFSQASANLTIAKERLKYAQFWFLKMTPLDDVAFNHLYAGNLQQAIEIWDKKNCVSSLQNKVITNFIALNFDQAINTAEDLYLDFSDEFLKVADSTGTLALTKDDLIQSFIDTLCDEYEPKKIYDVVFSDDWKEYLGGKTVKPLIARINAAIKEADDVDEKDADANLQAGRKLWKDTNDDFTQLKKMLPPDDMQLESIADKLGLQILQCGINYYNNSDDEDAAENAMALQKSASKIVMGEMAKDRCEDNLKVLEKIIAELPPKEVRKEFKEIENTLAMFVLKTKSISSAVWLLNTSKPIFQSIKSKIGSTHHLYIKFSTIIARMASSLIIDEVNDVQSSPEVRMRMQMGLRLDDSTIAKIKNTISEGWKAFAIIEEFDIDSEFRTNYNKNKASLKSLCQNLGISTAISTPKSAPLTTKIPY